MKSKKRISRKPEDWEVVYNTHEGIVTQEQWNLAQEIMNKRRHEKNR